jgi:TIR domain
MTAAARQTFSISRVFLSHAQGDHASADRLARLLAAGGRVQLFMDRMLSPAEAWSERLRRELEECDVFMVIGSPRAATSDRVLQELGGAWALDKPIVVVSPAEGWSWQLPVATHGVKHVPVGDLEQPGFIENLLTELICASGPSVA